MSLEMLGHLERLEAPHDMHLGMPGHLGTWTLVTWGIWRDTGHHGKMETLEDIGGTWGHEGDTGHRGLRVLQFQ